MRILVTGGAGFIGSHLVDALLEQGHELGVLDDFSTGRRENVPKGARVYELDLRDRAATLAAVADFRPDAVSHQAAQASVAISVREPALDAAVNVVGGLHVLDACTQPGARVAQVVFASTGGAIYGEVPDGTLAAEEFPPVPASPYAIHKLTFERLLGVYQRERGLASTTLRYANVYGPRQDPHGEAGVVAIFFGAVRAGRALRVNARARHADEGCVRDYVHVSDVVRANLAALSGKLSESLMNVGTGVGTSTRALAEAILRVSGRELPLEPGAHRPGDLERSVLDVSRARRALGEPVALSEGLTSTYEFYASGNA